MSSALNISFLCGELFLRLVLKFCCFFILFLFLTTESNYDVPWYSVFIYKDIFIILCNCILYVWVFNTSVCAYVSHRLKFYEVFCLCACVQLSFLLGYAGCPVSPGILLPRSGSMGYRGRCRTELLCRCLGSNLRPSQPSCLCGRALSPQPVLSFLCVELLTTLESLGL